MKVATDMSKAKGKHSVMTTVQYGDAKYNVSVSGKGIRISRNGPNGKIYLTRNWGEYHQVFEEHFAEDEEE